MNIDCSLLIEKEPAIYSDSDPGVATKIMPRGGDGWGVNDVRLDLLPK